MKKLVLLGVALLVAVAVTAQTTSAVDTLSALSDDVTASVLSLLRDLGISEASVRVLPVAAAGREIPASDAFVALQSTRLAQRASGVRVLTGGTEERAAIEVRTEALPAGDEVLLIAQVVWTDDETVRAGAEVRAELTDENRSVFVSTGAFASGGGAGEPDDMPEQATAMDATERIAERALERQGDVDWYAVRAVDVPYVEDGEVMLTIQTSGSTDTYIELYGPDDVYSLIAENDDYRDGNARVTVPVDAGATYYAAVRGFADSSTGPYALETSYYVAQLDPFEPDNTMENATPIALGEHATGHTLVPSDDVDWYVVDVNTLPEPFIISFRTQGELDTVIELYDEFGSLIGSDDDSGGNGNANLLHLVNAPQTFYVLVRTFSGSAEGPYALSVTRDQSEPDAYEPDNEPESAGPIEINELPQERTFLSSGDVDWLVFDLPETATVVAETYGDADSYLRLYNEQLSLIAEDDDSGDGFNAQIRRPLSPGRYYIEASPLYGEVNTRYEIAVMTQ